MTGGTTQQGLGVSSTTPDRLSLPGGEVYYTPSHRPHTGYSFEAESKRPSPAHTPSEDAPGSPVHPLGRLRLLPEPPAPGGGGGGSLRAVPSRAAAPRRDDGKERAAWVPLDPTDAAAAESLRARSAGADRRSAAHPDPTPTPTSSSDTWGGRAPRPASHPSPPASPGAPASPSSEKMRRSTSVQEVEPPPPPAPWVASSMDSVEVEVALEVTLEEVTLEVTLEEVTLEEVTVVEEATSQSSPPWEPGKASTPNNSTGESSQSPPCPTSSN
ncbi:mucin-1-like [Lethenteron reissneri]|uniref:mucin-1-like n=1 Tax=Lethenteron reissneri TaxID=7753 RepID=UPI002AB60853|nr:mucin-1-like [Lethenteron reissneri]